MVFSLITLWAVRVPLTYYLVFVAGWAETGIWVAVVMGDVVGCIAGLAWYARGTWKERYVEVEETRPTGVSTED